MKPLDSQDFWIMVFLRNDKAHHEFTAAPISSMLKYMSDSDAQYKTKPLKRNALFQRIKNLLAQELIAEGVKSGKEKAYYLTQKGADFLNPNRKAE